MAIFISYPIITRDANIGLRLLYWPDTVVEGLYGRRGLIRGMNIKSIYHIFIMNKLFIQMYLINVDKNRNLFLNNNKHVNL